ncbi:hypothetical protein BOW53_02940 [Solemya pervernicosa gill symbiont]|uniref:Mu-like prophage FluMu protein gp29 n=1 Tax=Solemya pervernicosa gill symbiont TaxID=642797 RepID=A0A1T2L998_9GAMM|nr:DUF935 domain-containing protein [Solemya pervernicosa gill symbiont]OOZ41650.1 hypothetical protein BOW53_02940 [Solemya pervernicosa gill symbiont]
MERTSRIVDRNGQPIRTKLLTEEIATASTTGVRNIWGNNPVAENLTPDRLAQILRSAAEGDAHEQLTLAEEMEEREPHYGSVLGTRKRAVTKLPINIEAASDESKDLEIAEAVREQFRRPEFRSMKKALMDALGKSYSAVEIMWDRGALWQPAAFEWRDPRFFRFDRETGRELRLLDESDMLNGIALEPYKFIVHRPQLKMGLPIRSGLARLVAVSYMCKSYALTDWLAFAEVFGMPIRVGRYGPGASNEDINTLISAVANIGSDAAAAIPNSMNIEFIEGGKSAGGHELFQRLAEWLDKQTSKAVLGQTMTTDDGSSQSQANVHNEVREDIQEDDAADLAETLNRDVIRPFVDLNFGPQENYPRAEINIPQPENIEALAKALEVFVPLGLQVKESEIRDKLSLTDPEDGDLLLSAPAAATPPIATATAENHAQHCSHSATALNREGAPSDAIDELEAEALEEWEQQLAPIVDPIQLLANESQSFEEFLAGLTELEMDSAEVVKTLALQSFKARGVGDVEQQ